ncbi:MFS transporter [Rickettsia endosymbiont of Orchestes rusci]|uniref:MFS transporter n=1 Tax=Rickettsia endosymbiont of Orchestes rusci TaxID=3066250 RepID=UPI00209EA91B|nr:MFS transporter [Rickettsia endosymbiont of Ceutorhynchus assimilis]
MLGYGKEQKSLTREQKQAVGLLSIGTFLEYFDLMLYVHMAVLLNELFFPKADPHTAAIYSAFAFCSIFVVRPIGALVFGWIGDNIGRKSTVIITTFMMAISCFAMAVIPTYAEKGLIATILVTLCRVAQGMSSMGEIVGAEIYLTELIKPPAQYPAVMLIAIFSILGGTAALGIASLVTMNGGDNWRIAFFIGAGVAGIGTIARTALKETKDFADAKRRLKKTFEKVDLNEKIFEDSPLWQEKVSKKKMLALLLIQCGWPVCFYITYIYCGNLLKQQFGYTPEEVIHQNFIVSIINLLGYIILTCLSYKIHPLKILKIKIWIFFPFALLCPYIFNNISSPLHLFLIQSFFMLFVLSTNPATPVFYTHISILKRFMVGSFIYAISRAMIHVITSFGLVYLVGYFNQWGLLFIILPMVIGYAFGVFYFIKLEKGVGNYQ